VVRWPTGVFDARTVDMRTGTPGRLWPAPAPLLSRRILAIAALTGLVIGFVAEPWAPTAAGAGPVAAAPAQAVDTSPRPDPESAAAAARLAAVPVEDLSRRTDREQVFANPDGSWTWQQASEAVRVRRVDGSWTAVDTTLLRLGNQVRPAATAYDIRFSNGGAGPLVRIAHGGGRLAFGLPWALPRPVLDGPRARYPEVLPGVDLVVTARPEGFTEVLVVKDRQAAANPALRQLRFSVEAHGLTLKAERGGFAAVDPTGATVFDSPPPLMWDSAGGPAERTVDQPADGDVSARMATTVRPTQLTVVPDATVLDDAGTVFPVYLDPAVSGSRNEWAMLSSGFPSQEYYKWTGTEGVGLCDVQDDSDCVRDQTKRLVWEFGLPSAIRGARILASTFSAYETHAYDCTARAVQLWLVGGISASTNWSNHTDNWIRQLHSVSVARRSGCANEPGRVEFNSAGGAAEAASSGWTTLTLGLKAGNESTMSLGWKQFRNDATLSITYNSAPRTPTSLSTDGTGCATGSARGVISTATPTIRAVVSDPDAGDNDLRASFAWQRLDQSVSPAVWRALGSGQQTALRSGATGQVRIASGLVNNGIYRWQAQTVDPWSYGGSSGTDSSAWSGWCEFTVDTVGPGVAPAVSSPLYGTDLNQVYGGVGRTAPFTFTASGVADVTAYRWGWADPPTTTVSAASLGAAVTVSLTPPPPKPVDPTSGGLMTLYVVSVDRAGRTSPATVYNVNIGSGTAPVARWDMAEAPGATTLVDSSGGGRHATVVGATTGAASRSLGGPGTVALDGVDDHAVAVGVPVDTAGSFSVSAWLRPTPGPTGVRDAVAFGGTRSSAFWIRQNPDGRWVLYAARADVDDPPRAFAIGTTATRPGIWTHVTAVHDAGSALLRLYVNGVLEGTLNDPAMFRATADVQFGRVRWAGGYLFPWRGDVAEVRVWDRVLSGPEVAPMAATLAGRWRLDGDGSDASPYGRHASGPDTLLWTDDRSGLPLSAASLNGTDEALTTADPALRTDQSFTVAAWVRLNVDTGPFGAVSQDGATVGGFFLGFRHTPQARWEFMMPPADATGSAAARAFGGPVELGAWTHLAGVHDAAAGRITLYVNGAPVAWAAAGAAWPATGPLAIGRYKWATGPVDFWPGDVDDVRVYQGALPATEIAQLAEL
jgi:hypothetical protein